MSTNPFISVLTASYNYERFLPKYFEGLASQTFHDFEVIFINDGSQDHTMELLSDFQKSHPEISFQIIDQENHGLPYCRNLGFDKARGEYIFFHDTDDWMDPACLKLLADKAKETHADRIIGAFREVDATGKTIQERLIPENPSKWLHIALPACLFKTSIIQEHQFRCKNYHRDDYYIANLFNCYTKTVAYVYQPTFNFMVAGLSYFSSQNKKDPRTSVWSFQEQANFFEEHLKLVKDSPEDIVMMQYQFIKAYYTMITFYNNYCTTAQAIQNYKEIHNIMKEVYPDYLTNENNHLLGGSNGGRPSIQKKTWLLMTLEKLHIFVPALWLYKQVSKVYKVKI